MSKLQVIKDEFEFEGGISTENIKWLIEQAEKYQRVRDKLIEQTIKKNMER